MVKLLKILTIGGTGMLGSSIMLTETTHDLYGTYLYQKPKSTKMKELDITDEKWVEKILNEINPDAIIHTAAITDVDLCEKKPDFARKVHVDGTRNLVRYARELKAYFLYISTDSVFDGVKGNYKETETPNPMNVYAKTKFEGEVETLKYINSSVIRVNIYGYNWLPKQSIAEWILNTLKKKEPIKLFTDVYFSPILVNHLTEFLFEIVERKLKGIYHVSEPEGISKFNFGRLLAKIYNLNRNLIVPISISSINLKAFRPLNPTLDCSKIQQETNKRLLNAQEGLLFFKKIGNSNYLNKLKNL